MVRGMGQACGRRVQRDAQIAAYRQAPSSIANSSDCNALLQSVVAVYGYHQRASIKVRGPAEI